MFTIHDETKLNELNDECQAKGYSVAISFRRNPKSLWMTPPIDDLQYNLYDLDDLERCFERWIKRRKKL